MLVAPDSLRLPERRREQLTERGCAFREVAEVAEAVESVDVLYVTRIQRERFGDPLDYERVRGAYQIDAELLERNPATVVMHPLPRVDEIHPSVDALPQAAYFEQARNGVTVRKTLLSMLLGALPE